VPDLWGRLWKEPNGCLRRLVDLELLLWPAAFALLGLLTLALFLEHDPLWWRPLYWGLVGMGWGIVVTAVAAGVALLSLLWQDLLVRRRKRDGGTVHFPTLGEAVKRRIDFERWCR